MSFVSKVGGQVFQRMYNYYNPMFRANSVTPLAHMFVFTSVTMYSVSYLARDYPVIQHKREIEKLATAEYYEKHGGSPDHH